MVKSHAEESSVKAGRLRYDHRTFATRLVEARRRANIDGWLALVGEWDGISADIVRHFAFEELAVFPGFARHKPGEAALIRRLLDEHDAIERLVEMITGCIADAGPDDLLLDDLVAKMGDHESTEGLRLYPWLELQERAHDPGGRPIP